MTKKCALYTGNQGLHRPERILEVLNSVRILPRDIKMKEKKRTEEGKRKRRGRFCKAITGN